MPAAAVIPAPIAYIKVVAVKKLVVEFQDPFLQPATVSLRSVCFSVAGSLFLLGGLLLLASANGECLVA